MASWSDLCDLSDLPEVGTADFLAAMTDEQRNQFNMLQTEDERSTYQTTLREQTIANRRTAHQNGFPLSDNLMSLIFLVQSDLNEQQRERFVSSMNIRQVAMPQYTYLQVKQLFLELFCVSRTGAADPNIAHRKRSSFFIVDEGETEEGEQGFWVVDEDTGEEGFTGLYTENEFWVLGAKGSYSRRRLYGRSSRKVNQRVMVRKENAQDPASVRGQKAKAMQRMKMTNPTQLSGEKENSKEKANRARKE